MPYKDAEKRKEASRKAMAKKRMLTPVNPSDEKKTVVEPVNPKELTEANRVFVRLRENVNPIVNPVVPVKLQPVLTPRKPVTKIYGVPVYDEDSEEPLPNLKPKPQLDADGQIIPEYW